jgi:4-amino-4-deoxychorismate lyase
MIYFYKNGFHEDQVRLNIQGPAFKFGFGFFETLFYNQKKICHLNAHLTRLFSSLETFSVPFQRVDFESVILEVLYQNGLLNKFARINIYYFLDSDQEASSPLIAATPYSSAPDKTYQLYISPNHLHTHLSSHKSMNYMYYYLERTLALQKGFDDALITNLGNHILEASTASLLFSDGIKFYSPASKYKLSSTSVAVASSVLDIKKKAIGLDNLPAFKYVYVLNSLIGMKPVVRINDFKFDPDYKTCRLVSKKILFP